MDKLLVTRSETLVGANLAPVLGNRLDVVGLETGTSTSDACAAIHSERPQLVVHSGPLSVSAWDAAGLGATKLLNRADVNREAEYLTYVVAACREVGAKLVVAASDVIFDGPRMFHDENSPPSARRAFGKAAAQVEAALRGSGALLLRSHVYGWCPAGYGANYAERMFEELTGEMPCAVDAVRHATPILATDFAELIYAAYRADLSGLYHAAGAERTSPYRFAAEMAAALGTPGRYVSLSARDAASRRPYVDETSLNTLAFRRAIEQPLPMLREGLARFAAQAFNGHRNRVSGGVAKTSTVARPRLMAHAA